MAPKIDKFLASVLGRIKRRVDDSCANPSSPVANTSQRERCPKRKAKRGLYSHPEGNRPWCHISERMKHFPATGPKRGGKRKSRRSSRLLLGGEHDYMTRLDFVRDSEVKNEKDEQKKKPTDNTHIQRTKKILRNASEGGPEERKISLHSVATRTSPRNDRIPDDYIWAERNPGGLATIDEEGREEGNPVLPPSFPTAPEPDADKGCSEILDKIPQEKKQKDLEEYGTEELRRDSGFSNQEEIAPREGEESVKDDTDNEDWQPAVIADEDIPEQVELGLFRYAKANPEDAPWWTFSDRHFHQLESEREVVEQQKCRVVETKNTTSSSSPASAITPAITPSDHTHLSEFKAIRFEDLSPEAATETLPSRTTATKQRNDDKTKYPSSSSTKPHTHTSWFGFPLPPTSRSAPLPKIHFSEPEVAASKETNESDIHRRPSALDRIKYSLFPRPESPLPPPQRGASPVGALSTRFAADARPAGSGSGTTSAAPTPPPKARARYLEASTEEKRLREEHRTMYYRQVSLDKLDGRVPAPEFSKAGFQEWKSSSAWARALEKSQ